jgi:hypothetical protein
MGQNAVMTAPITSACAATASIVLAAVSNMRMLVLLCRECPARTHVGFVSRGRNKRAQQSCLQQMQPTDG